MTMDRTLDGIRDIKIYQNRDGYRFSVDALLLYTFVNVKYAKSIVDLGTGSGVIGLLLARKYHKADVVLVELQESLFTLAVMNAKMNGLDRRARVLLADIRRIKEEMEELSADLVVSNPPFRKPSSGRLSVGEERAVARHELSLRLPELAGAASHLLKARGRFCIIFHPGRLAEAFAALREERLEPKRIRFVHNDLDAVSKIVLIEAVKDARPGIKVEHPLILYQKDGSYTEEVQAMYALDREEK